jgi:hypothetical protein
MRHISGVLYVTRYEDSGKVLRKPIGVHALVAEARKALTEPPDPALYTYIVIPRM